MEHTPDTSNVIQADFRANRQAIARANSPFGPVRAGLIVPKMHGAAEVTPEPYRTSAIIGYYAGLACGNPAELGDDGVTYYDC